MKDRRPLIVLVVVVLALASVAVFLRRDESTANPGTKQSTSVTAAPATPQWREALDRATALENELFQNPDPTRVGEMMAVTCSCHKETVARLTALKKNQRHVSGDSFAIRNVEQLPDNTPDRVVVAVTLGALPSPTVNSLGQAVSPGPSGSTELIYQLEKQPDGNWLIADRRPARNAGSK